MNPDYRAFWALLGEDALAEYDALDEQEQA